jgi:hypothetical protein
MLLKQTKDIIKMNSCLIRKIIIVIIILLPVLFFQGCKKQAKCGCGKDILFSIDKNLMDYSSISYSSNGKTASFLIYNGIYYDTYIFCNPEEMYSTYTDLSGEEQVLISGDVFWDCTYMMNSSNSYYYSYYKVYNIEITGMKSYLYGKK